MVAENLNNDMLPVGTTVHINPEDIKAYDPNDKIWGIVVVKLDPGS